MSYTAPTPVASGVTFAQLQAAGLSGHIEKLLAAQVATVAPTVAATATATGGGSTGGLLAAGTYYFVISESNGFGETLVGPESSQLTVSATNIPRITFQTLKSGNVSRKIYLGAVNGPSGGPYTLYAKGITTSTYDMSVAAPTGEFAPAPPTVNTTVPSGAMIQFLRAAYSGRLDQPYVHARQVLNDFLRGGRIGWIDCEENMRKSHAAFIMIKTAFDEIMTLIDANPGHMTIMQTGISNIGYKRVFP
jgi:hypothetical protein